MGDESLRSDDLGRWLDGTRRGYSARALALGGADLNDGLGLVEIGGALQVETSTAVGSAMLSQEHNVPCAQISSGIK